MNNFFFIEQSSLCDPTEPEIDRFPGEDGPLKCENLNDLYANAGIVIDRLTDTIVLEEWIDYDDLEELRTKIADKPAKLQNSYSNLYAAFADYKISLDEIQKQISDVIIDNLSPSDSITTIQSDKKIKDLVKTKVDEKISNEKLAQYCSLIDEGRKGVLEYGNEIDNLINAFMVEVIPQLEQVDNQIVDLTSKYDNANGAELESAKNEIEKLTLTIQEQHQDTMNSSEKAFITFKAGAEAVAAKCESGLKAILNELQK